MDVHVPPQVPLCFDELRAASQQLCALQKFCRHGILGRGRAPRTGDRRAEDPCGALYCSPVPGCETLFNSVTETVQLSRKLLMVVQPGSVVQGAGLAHWYCTSVCIFAKSSDDRGVPRCQITIVPWPALQLQWPHPPVKWSECLPQQVVSMLPLRAGIYNSNAVQPVVSQERPVFYRERAAGKTKQPHCVMLQACHMWPSPHCANILNTHLRTRNTDLLHVHLFLCRPLLGSGIRHGRGVPQLRADTEHLCFRGLSRGIATPCCSVTPRCPDKSLPVKHC